MFGMKNKIGGDETLFPPLKDVYALSFTITMKTNDSKLISELHFRVTWKNLIESKLFLQFVGIKIG